MYGVLVVLGCGYVWLMFLRVRCCLVGGGWCDVGEVLWSRIVVV